MMPDKDGEIMVKCADRCLRLPPWVGVAAFFEALAGCPVFAGIFRGVNSVFALCPWSVEGS